MTVLRRAFPALTTGTQEIVLACLIAVAAVILRLADLGAWSLWGDEVASLNLASAPVPAILARTSDLYPPLYSVFLHFWQRAGSGAAMLLGEAWLPGEVWIRTPSALAGIATIACVAWAAAQLAVPHRRTVVLLAAALLALSPLHIWYSREARMYALAAFFATAALACYLGLLRQARLLRQAEFGSRRLKDGEDREARSTRRLPPDGLRVLRASRSSETSRLRDPNPTAYALGYVIFMLLGIYTAYANLLFWAAGLVVAPVLAPALYGVSALSRRYWLAQAAVALGFAPYLPVVAAQVGYGNFGFLAERVGLAAAGAAAPAAGSLGAAVVLALLVVLAVLALVITLTQFRRRGRRLSGSIFHLPSSIFHPSSIVIAFALLTVLGAIPRGLSIKRQLLVFWPIAVVITAAVLVTVAVRVTALSPSPEARQAAGLQERGPGGEAHPPARAWSLATPAILLVSLVLSAAMLAGGPFEDWRGAAAFVTSSAPHAAVYLQSAWARDAFAHYYRGDGPLYAPGPARAGRPGTWASQPPAIAPSSAATATAAMLVLNDHPSLTHEVAPLVAWLAARGEQPGSAHLFPRYLSVAPVRAGP